jgi:hypothetical protein
MKPWREIAVPHRDVLEGTFQQSEFAADITAVHTGKASRDHAGSAATGRQRRRASDSTSDRVRWRQDAHNACRLSPCDAQGSPRATRGRSMIKDADLTGTSPGKDMLRELLEQHAPCVVLIDELVAYIRQFPEGQTLSGGTYDSNLSFRGRDASCLAPPAVG